MTENQEKEQVYNTSSSTFIKHKMLFIKIISAMIGVLGGYLYYYFVGCSSGGCAITSNPYMSMLWGGLLGYLISDMFTSKKKDDNKKESLE